MPAADSDTRLIHAFVYHICLYSFHFLLSHLLWCDGRIGLNKDGVDRIV
jgi:hypothetical protein